MPRHPASYRDPAGHVHFKDGRVFRTVLPAGADHYQAVKATGWLDRSRRLGWTDLIFLLVVVALAMGIFSAAQERGAAQGELRAGPAPARSGSVRYEFTGTRPPSARSCLR